jgi:hypothetical protein
MKYYLTDTIFVENNIYYHENNGKNQKIKEKDWHIHLNEYGWNKMNIQWIKILNKISLEKKHNSLFGVLDCGGDGNCLFNCINYAMNGFDNIFGIERFREGFSDSITEEDFININDIYKISKNCGEFKENWDPYEITYEEFKMKVKMGGDEYWGDFLILNLIKDYLNVNFVVLYSNDMTGEYYNYPIFFEYNDELMTIILLYENDNHFKLVGNYKTDRMIYNFKKDSIPNEILRIIKEIR